MPNFEDPLDVIDEKKIYYHYCSLDTFIKIIDSNKIRLCNPYKMNDSKELSWFFDLLPSVVDKFVTKIEDEEIRERYKYFYENALPEIYKEQFLNKEAPYITCFSECGDLLSQWRAYADNGKGVSIGFDINLLIQGNQSDLMFRSICYDTNSQSDILLKKLKSNGFDNPESIEFHRIKHVFDAAFCLIYDILVEAVSSKNPAFIEEKEGRLIYFPQVLNINDKNENKPFEITGPFFRSNGQDIISFYELDFSKLKQKFINSIYIGPKCKATEYDINALLKAKGYTNEFFMDSIIITNSDASYR